MSFWGIVVAAGRGDRFGGVKALVDLDGRPLWEWARTALEDGGAAGMVVVGPVPGGVAGGATRRDSVAAGLELVPPHVEHVLVHDAARPLASPDLVQRVWRRLEKGDAVAVVPVVPVTDTVKRVADDGIVEDTPPRRGLYAVQTPQGFLAAALRRAHATVADDVTDDAALVEALGLEVATVPGERSNLKITFPDDLKIAQALR